MLGMRLRAEFSGEDLSAAPARRIASMTARIKLSGRVAERSSTWEVAATESGASPAMVAIVEKEFRSLFRTLPLLYAVGAPLLMVLVVSGGFLRGSMSTHAPVFAFPLCVFFAQLGFHQLWGNSLGTEGAGVQTLFSFADIVPHGAVGEESFSRSDLRSRDVDCRLAGDGAAWRAERSDGGYYRGMAAFGVAVQSGGRAIFFHSPCRTRSIRAAFRGSADRRALHFLACWCKRAWLRLERWCICSAPR